MQSIDSKAGRVIRPVFSLWGLDWHLTEEYSRLGPPPPSVFGTTATSHWQARTGPRRPATTAANGAAGTQRAGVSVDHRSQNQRHRNNEEKSRRRLGPEHLAMRCGERKPARGEDPSKEHPNPHEQGSAPSSTPRRERDVDPGGARCARFGFRVRGRKRQHVPRRLAVRIFWTVHPRMLPSGLGPLVRERGSATTMTNPRAFGPPTEVRAARPASSRAAYKPD